MNLTSEQQAKVDLFRKTIEQGGRSSSQHSVTFDRDGVMHISYTWASLTSFWAVELQKAGLTGLVCFWCRPEDQFNYPPRTLTFDLDSKLAWVAE